MDPSTGALTPGTGNLPSSLTFGPGKDKIIIRVIAKDDALSENPEQLTVIVKPDTNSGNPGYHVTDGSGGLKSTDSSTLIDDTDPSLGGSEAHYDGPYVRVVILDSGGNPVSASSVAEDGGELTYRVELVDRVTGQPYTADEDVTVTLNVTGGPGAVLHDTGKDYDFTNLPAGCSYDSSTGELIIKVSAGNDNTEFTGKAIFDTAEEGPESIGMIITDVDKNEASIHPTQNNTTVTIVEVPLVSVVVNVTDIFESNVVRLSSQR